MCSDRMQWNTNVSADISCKLASTVCVYDLRAHQELHFFLLSSLYIYEVDS